MNKKYLIGLIAAAICCTTGCNNKSSEAMESSEQSSEATESSEQSYETTESSEQSSEATESSEQSYEATESSEQSSVTESAENVYKDEAEGVKYTFIITDRENKQCTLQSITDIEDDNALTKKSELNIPSELNGYTVIELGVEDQAVIHNADVSATPLESLTLPASLKKINALALDSKEVPDLKTLGVDLNALESCAENAFGSANYPSHGELNRNEADGTNQYDSCCALNTICFVGADNGEAVSIDSTDAFETYFGLLSATYAADAKGFQLNDAALDGRLEFLNAVSSSPYCKKIGYEYAKKIAKEYGMDAADLGKHDKVEMAYNYLQAQVCDAYLETSDGNKMRLLAETSLGALALHCGSEFGVAHSFEQLCRASGMNVTDSPADSDVVCVRMRIPSAAASIPSSVKYKVVNAVHIYGGDGYYIVNAASKNQICFMKGTLQENSLQNNMYVYGIDTTTSQMRKNSSKFDQSLLSANEYCDGHSYVHIKGDLEGLQIEIIDKNKPAHKYINFTAPASPASEDSLNVTQFARQDVVPQFLSSYIYLEEFINGEKLLNTKLQSVTVDDNSYDVRFEVLDYAAEGQEGVNPANAYTGYYSFDIQKLETRNSAN